MHILGNMMGLYFFGPVLEQTLGKNKFLILYFGAGLGGVFLNGLINYLEISKLLPSSIEYQIQMATPMIGASGAIFGILAAFTKLFPNIKMMIFPIPFEIKAKYLIPLYAAFEIYSGFFRKDSNIGHFAHIGGLIVGIILIIYWFGWKKKIF
ncbi:MAG: rhomboid family intramembrane serine protease [Arcicella sp.]|nr:rhomboid family intramembrane serine protease [Arcicella sp.]